MPAPVSSAVATVGDIVVPISKYPEVVEQSEAINTEVVNYAVSVGGTVTSEHGVGIGRRRFMAAEHGASRAPGDHGISVIHLVPGQRKIGPWD